MDIDTVLLAAAVSAILPWLGLLVVLLFFSAFFSGSESALFSLDSFTLKELTENGGRAGRTVGHLLEKPRKLLATLLLGNELVNISLSAVGVRMVFELKHVGVSIPWWTNVIVVTPLLLLFGEIAPKVVAVRLGAIWARLVALPLTVFGTAIAPFRGLLHGVADFLIGVLGQGGPDPLPDALQEAQFKALVDLGEAEGVLHKEEAELIHRVFDLGDLPVSRLMTPRGEVASVSLSASLDEILEVVRKRGFSRLPVYVGEPDKVRGVLMAKDLLPFRFGDQQLTARRLEELLKPSYIVPPGKPASELMQEFRSERSHMALVFDELGATMLGVVTMQDLLGELFEGLPVKGVTRPSLGIERISDGVFRVPAKLPIDAWNRTLQPRLPEGDAYTTVAGYIFHLFGHLPRKGEEIAGAGWIFRVSGLEGTRLTWITARRPGAPAAVPPARVQP